MATAYQVVVPVDSQKPTVMWQAMLSSGPAGKNHNTSKPQPPTHTTTTQATNGEYSKSELVLVLNRTDNGRPYRCEASNAASDEPRSGSVTMAVLFKPQVVKIT